MIANEKMVWHNTLGREESLHPDLAFCVEQNGLPVLRHPLIVHVPYFPQMNAFINLQFEVKKSALNMAIEAGDLERIAVLHERPWRATAIAEYERLATDKVYWETLAWAYTDSENIDECWPLWQTLLNSPRPGRIHMMSSKEQGVLSALPDTLTVFRGGMPGELIRDASWTLDIDVARWFARRFDQPGCVLQGEVNKSDIIAYQEGRGEAEIMIFPSKVREMEMIEDRPARVARLRAK